MLKPTEEKCRIQARIRTGIWAREAKKETGPMGHGLNRLTAELKVSTLFYWNFLNEHLIFLQALSTLIKRFFKDLRENAPFRKAVLWILIVFNGDLGSHILGQCGSGSFLIRIKGFDDRNFKNFTAGKNPYFFLRK
jgi:hypothetical protein